MILKQLILHKHGYFLVDLPICLPQLINSFNNWIAGINFKKSRGRKGKLTLSLKQNKIQMKDNRNKRYLAKYVGFTQLGLRHLKTKSWLFIIYQHSHSGTVNDFYLFIFLIRRQSMIFIHRTAEFEFLEGI